MGCLRRLVHACPGLFLLERFPQLVPQAIPWTGSANRWIRRVSAVCLVFSLRRGHALADALKVANVLLLDPDIMVQKGYGWMLKEATRSFPEPVMDFVMRHRREMPRTALRYAIEKLPPDWKRTAMEHPAYASWKRDETLYFSLRG